LYDSKQKFVLVILLLNTISNKQPSSECDKNLGEITLVKRKIVNTASRQRVTNSIWQERDLLILLPTHV